MPFLRRRSNNSRLLNASSIATERSQLQSQPTTEDPNIDEHIDKLLTLQSSLPTLPRPSWQNSLTTAFTSVLTHAKNSPIPSQLMLYHSCMSLFATYQSELKKHGEQADDDNSAIVFQLFIASLQDLVRITKEQKNDKLVMQGRLVQPAFACLQSLAAGLEKGSHRSEQRKSATIFRKNSLKKVDHLPAIRPLSRGKLSSLSKKDSNSKQLPLTSKDTLLSKQSLIISTPKQLRKQQYPTQTILKTADQERTSFSEQAIQSLSFIVKNLSANERIRKQLLQQHNLRILNRYLSIWNNHNISQLGTQLLSQFTACYRHLAVQEKSHVFFLSANCFQVWTKLLQTFPSNNQIVFNILRILSKLSNYQSCCERLNQSTNCLQCLCTSFKLYKTHIHIIIRVAFIFAYLQDYAAT